MTRISGLEPIGWMLLNSFWQFGLLVLLYLVITGRDNRFTASFRHNIAATFSLLGSFWVFFGFLSRPAQLTLGTGTGPLATAAQKSSFFILETFEFSLNRFVSFLPWLYIAVLLLRSGNALHGLLQRRKPAQPVYTASADHAWKYFLNKCARELHIRRPVILRWTSGTGMARTYGFFRPVVLFPVALINQLSTAQVEAILVHELAHIRRHDYVTHLWMSLFRFIFYFNPFARFFYDVVSSEREQACDDLVLTRSYPATDYAYALMTLEQFRQRSNLMLAASGHRPLQLADRIRRIAGLPVVPVSRRPLLSLLLAVLMTAGAVYLIGPATAARGAGKKPASSHPGTVASELEVKKTIVAPVNVMVPPPPIVSMAEPPAARGVNILIPANPSGENEMTANAEFDRNASPDSSLFERLKASPAAEGTPGVADPDSDNGVPDYVAVKTIRNFSYQAPEQAPAPVSRAAEANRPFVPSSSFEYPVMDSVPEIALQSLQENKPAVLQLLGRWKALQLQQRISRTLEMRYQQLKIKAEKDLKGLKTVPAKQAELKKSMDQLKRQMEKRKAEIDRLSTVLAEEPVIYI